MKIENAIELKRLNSLIIPSLIEEAKKKGDRHTEDQLYNVLRCMETIWLKEAGYSSNFCKSRVCLICSYKKQANLYSRTIEEVKSWTQPTAVTLTISHTGKSSLRQILNKIIKTFSKIIKYVRYHLGSKNYKLIRNLHLLIDSSRDNNHPHFHCITENSQIAQLLTDQWVHELKNEGVSRKAQDIAQLATEKDLLKWTKYMYDGPFNQEEIIEIVKTRPDKLLTTLKDISNLHLYAKLEKTHQIDPFSSL
ncbi:protein rep [bacterium]|nr:protein rep [bacterium]